MIPLTRWCDLSGVSMMYGNPNPPPILGSTMIGGVFILASFRTSVMNLTLSRPGVLDFEPKPGKLIRKITKDINPNPMGK